MVGNFNNLGMPPDLLVFLLITANILAAGLFLAGLIVCLASIFTPAHKWLQQHCNASFFGFYLLLGILAFNIIAFVIFAWKGWLNNSDMLIVFIIFNSISAIGAGEWAFAAGMGRHKGQY